MEESQVIYLRIKKKYLKHIDELIKTRMYKDRPHFFEVSIINQLNLIETQIQAHEQR